MMLSKSRLATPCSNAMPNALEMPMGKTTTNFASNTLSLGPVAFPGRRTNEIGNVNLVNLVKLYLFPPESLFYPTMDYKTPPVVKT
ncbi:Protein of unknown function [Pyronema omphalodes CBS 100304]|uniref:Uncharacterized protein n=1 Tax=Pyronema omphalodes (strain CBS 100304) TaxID=1076935 RepID=U4LRD8_PYROM|nr:Protein of unknown function [Pyronema omphalodes CBS 100304]